MPWFRHGYERCIPSLTWQSDPQIDRVLGMVPGNARIVDLGAGGRRLARQVVTVDFAPLPHTDVLASVDRLPFRDSGTDLIFATGLLEHVDDHRPVIAEMARILRPGGIAHIEVPFLQQYHEDPIDYRRFTVPGLAREMEQAGFETVKAGFHIGPTVTIVTLLAYYAALLTEGQSRIWRGLSTLVFAGVSAALFPLKFLDRFLLTRRSASRLAFGVYCTCRKRASGSTR